MSPATNRVPAPSAAFRFPLAKRWLAILAVVVLAAAGSAESKPQEPKGGAGAGAKGDKARDLLDLDKIKVPDNAIIFICDSVNRALRLAPSMMMISPKRYQEMQEEIAELKRKLKPSPPASPSTCQLEVLGSLDGDTLHLKAEFLFKTRGPKTLVALGCKGANLQKPKLDGGKEEALLHAGPDGLTIEVGPGQHSLTLEADAAVTSASTSTLGGGTDREVTIGLPRAAVTSFKLERLPADVKEMRCNDLVVREVGESYALGAAERLNLAWKKPVPLGGDRPLITADSKITVRVEEKHVVTEALLTLQDLNRKTTDWTLRTPPQATVEVVSVAGGKRGTAGWPRPLPAQGEGKVPPHTILPDARGSEHTIRLKQASEEPIGVLVRVRQPRSGSKVGIGPFQLLNAERRPRTLIKQQQGTILILVPPSDVQLNFRKIGGPLFPVSQGVVSDEDRRNSVVAVFHYWNVPGSARAGVPKGVEAYPPLLELGIRTIKGVAETWVEHVLELHEKDDGWEVQAETRIRVHLRQGGARVFEVRLPRPWPDALAIQACWPLSPGAPAHLALAAAAGVAGGTAAGLPARYTPDRNVRIDQTGLSEAAEDVVVDATGLARITLAEKKQGEFTLTLRGTYALPRATRAAEPALAFLRRAHLELPVLQKTHDRGGKVTITLPAEQELLLGGPGQEAPVLDRYKHTSSYNTAPGEVTFAWRPFRPDFPVRMVADVTLKDGKAEVKQRLQFPARQPLKEVFLQFVKEPRVSPALVRTIGKNLTVTLGGAKAPAPRLFGPGPWRIPLALREDRTLELQYSFPIPPAAGDRGALARGGPDQHLVWIPLLWPQQASRVETKVRVWSEPGPSRGTLVALEGGRWRENKTELVAGYDRLPLLVLSGVERALPLALRLRRAQMPTLAPALVERALIRVILHPGGSQTYHARFLVSSFNTSAVDVVLPPGGTNLSVRLGGKKINHRKVDEDREVRRAGDGDALRRGPAFQLHVEPDNYRRPVVLVVDYQILAEEPETEGRGWRWSTQHLQQTVYPPRLPGVLFLGRVRWQVELPSGQVVLNPGGEASSEQRWGLRGWLLAPQPALADAELQGWVDGPAQGQGVGRGRLTSLPGAAESEPNLLCWQNTPQPLHLVVVAQKTWLLVCSLLILALGLGLSFVPLSHGPFRILCWLVVVVVGLAAVLTAILWPAVVPDVIYGCEPGLAVLVPVLIIQWMLQRRYRRRLVFMPGFTRLKTTGSSLVRASGGTRPGEPSTVDAPSSAQGSSPK